MSDKPGAIFVTTLIAAPLMIVCCVGGVAMVTATAGGVAGFFGGVSLLTILSVAVPGVIVISIIRHKSRVNRDETNSETKNNERYKKSLVEAFIGSVLERLLAGTIAVSHAVDHVNTTSKPST